MDNAVPATHMGRAMAIAVDRLGWAGLGLVGYLFGIGCIRSVSQCMRE